MNREATPSARLLTKKTVSWMLYDVANSAYILLIPAVAFAVYYRNVVLGGSAKADTYWALLVSTSLTISGLVAPYLGALADVAGLRYRLFVVTTLVCCGATAVLSLVQPGQVVFGALAFVTAQAFYTWAIFFYDSYLKDLVSPDLSGKVSGLGWGVGYLGGLLCFAACYPLLARGLAPANLTGFRMTFVVTAAFYLLLAVPAFMFLRAIGTSDAKDAVPPGRTAKQAYVVLWHTLRNWRRNKEVFRFLLGFYLVSDAIVTVIFFTAIYLEQNFGLSVTRILVLTLVVQAIGAPSTIFFGYLGDRWGQKRVVLGTLFIWLVVIGIMIFGTSTYTPWSMAVVMGLVLGSTQSLLRSMYAQMVPPEAVNEFFGFNALAGKVSAVLGPLAFAGLSGLAGSQRVGLLSLVAFFLFGGFVLATVRLPVRTNQPDSIAPPPQSHN